MFLLCLLYVGIDKIKWLGNGTPSDPIFNQFFASQLQQQSNTTLTTLNNVHASISLLSLIGPAILVTHSHGGPYGWGIADAVPSLVHAIVAIEPEGPPFVGEIIAHGPARPWVLRICPSHMTLPFRIPES